MALEPTAIELADRAIIDAGLAQLSPSDPIRRIFRQDSKALLFVEFMEGNRVDNARRLKELGDVMLGMRHVRAVSEVTGAVVQRGSWAVRSAGLQHLYRQVRGHALPAEDFAVPVGRLTEAATAFTELFAKRGMPLIWHGHVGAGALHFRPLLAAGELQLADRGAIAEEMRALLTLFAGSMASERGYGIERSDALRRMLGGRLAALHEQIKLRFDPQNRLNPGKIVFPPLAEEPALRRANSEARPALIDAVGCDGNGLCRSLDQGMMCPSFRVTRDERDSPRGRANTIRLALTGALGSDAFTSEAMAETMKLCVSCKACQVECPQAVDIAGAKIAFEAARREKHPLSRFERAAAFLPHYGPRMRPWRHLLALRDIIPWMAPLSERLTGLAADRPWPRWGRHPFPSSEPIGQAGGREILLFADTFNAYFDVSTLHAAADVLSASGFLVRPLLPPEGERPFCCGRTFLEVGLIEEARREARRLIAAAMPFIDRGVPLVGLEPACLLTMRDEFPRLLKVEGVEQIAAGARLFEEVMAQKKPLETLKAQLHDVEADAVMFSHCHQRVYGTAALAKQVAEVVPGLTLREGEIACCGMGTSFGYRPDLVSISLQMGEQALFPQIRKTGRDTLLLADGFACRKQIQDGTGRTARHIAVLIKLALLAGERAGPGDSGGAAAKQRVARWRRRYFQ